MHRNRAFFRWAPFAAFTMLFCLAPFAAGQSPSGAARAAHALEQARQAGPLALYDFFHGMPKGADLHYHLAGAIYAETFIREAAEDHLCVNTKTLVLYKTAAMTRSLPPQPVCGEAGEPAANALGNQKLYDQLINDFSMRTFVPTTEESGHDHFFNAFDHFVSLSLVGKDEVSPVGEWIDEAATRAAAHNEQYLEIMSTPNFARGGGMITTPDPIDLQTDFTRLHRQLLDAGLKKSLPAQQAEFDDGEHHRRELEHCSDQGATEACRVKVRFLYQVLRALPLQAVFAQLVCGFELASTDPLIVGINMVQPEDWYADMSTYRVQMKMIQALHALYPKVHITLHAGELAPGMVTPDGLRFHIRLAVEEAGAERIGHGVDVMYEDRPYDLLKEMATKRVMTEINLTSNDVILNIKGADHPLPVYRRYHVPVALSTDDEGVSRINLTHEYVRAALSYPLTYADFKEMVRTGMEHNFLPGESLWLQTGPWESYAHPRPECSAQLGREQALGACARFLATSEKAKQQFELERRFSAFEKTF